MESLVRAQRPVERTRQVVLEAAADLFAERGYAATTLHQIGRRAGLSRGAPAYFFGSKERLYAAALTRAFSEADDVMRGAARQADEQGLRGRAAFRHAVGAYLTFLATHPRFVRLVEWEALGHGEGTAAADSHRDMVMAALDGLGDALRDLLPAGYDLTQLLLSIVGLCWFPVAHRETLARTLEVDPLAPEFINARIEHVTDLVLGGTTG